MQSTTQLAREMERALEEVQTCRTSIWVRKDGTYHQLEIVHKRGTNSNGEWRGNRAFTHRHRKTMPSPQIANYCCSVACPCPSDIPAAFAELQELIGTCEPLFDSLVVNAWTTDAPSYNSNLAEVDDELSLLDSTSEIYQKIRLAWCEMLGIQAPPVKPDSWVNPNQFRNDLIRIPMLALLADGKADVAGWNGKSLSERTLPTYNNADLQNKSMREINLSSLDFRCSRFDSADLTKANLTGANFEEASLVNAKLEKAAMAGLKARGADFTGAKLSGAEMKESELQHAIFADADFTKASLRKADLRNVDLTVCKNLDQVKFKGAIYDESTKLPANFPHLQDMSWKGRGSDPYKKIQKKALYESGPVDFKGLIDHLQKNFDEERLKKALSMLKKDTFQLYSEVTNDFVLGIVKSQTDKELVYACRLLADGSFACCTQNLNACGGLRGALCKHILVMVLGLARANDLSTTNAAHWVLASRVEKPQLDRDVMAEPFLKYQGAACGEIDWRPTETIPEDYYAF